MRRAAKVDKNQREIVEALRAAGCSVVITSHVGAGFPDIVVGRAGATYLLEIKGKRGKLTKPQVKFFDEWRGNAVVVRTVDEALKAVGLL